MLLDELSSRPATWSRKPPLDLRYFRDRRRPTAVLGVRSTAKEARMPTEPLNLAELDQRLSVVRDNLRELVEQAAAFSGAAGEELMSSRIAEQEEQLEALSKQREALLQPPA